MNLIDEEINVLTEEESKEVEERMRIMGEQAGELFVIWNNCIVPENKLINNAEIKILNLPPVSNYGRPVPPSCGKTNPWFTPNYAGIPNRRLHEPPFNPQLCSPAIEPTQNGLTFTVDRKTQFHPHLWSTPETYANKDPTPGLKIEANGLVLPGSPPLWEPWTRNNPPGRIPGTAVYGVGGAW